jgi:hypothetical protein
MSAYTYKEGGSERVLRCNKAYGNLLLQEEIDNYSEAA